MKKIKYLAIILLCAGCTNVRTIGNVNGLVLTRITTRGVFSPSTTTVVAHDPSIHGVINPVASASGPGVLPAIATAGGVAGGAALLRPARENVSANGSGSSSSSATGGAANSASTSTSTGGSNFVPPGQVNNPGHN
jgi:hypothetical protein